MFRNLEAEQARMGFTNVHVAEILSLSRTSYEKKKKSGKFTAHECATLCDLFNCEFKYLFATRSSA